MTGRLPLAVSGAFVTRDAARRARVHFLRDEDPVYGLVLRHDVPWGRLWRYYDTRGRLVLLAHRGWFHDSTAHLRPAGTTSDFGLLSSRLSGIPVFFE